MSGIIGLISVSAATVGASATIMAHLELASSTSPQTIATPTTGTRIRLIGWVYHLGSNAGNIQRELYFGTGSTVATNPASAVAHLALEVADQSDNVPMSYPDGAGPVGAVNEVISARVSATGDNSRVVILYREE